MNIEPIEILLVEDNPADVLLTQHAFESSKLHNTLHIAEDGEKALKILFQEGEHKDHPIPDLILLDLNLPKIEGREVLKTIKETEKLKRIPVIIMSGSSAERDVLESYDLHANAYVIKPVDLDQLASVVKTMDSFWFTMVKLPTDDEYE